MLFLIINPFSKILTHCGQLWSCAAVRAGGREDYSVRHAVGTLAMAAHEAYDHEHTQAQAMDVRTG